MPDNPFPKVPQPSCIFWEDRGPCLRHFDPFDLFWPEHKSWKSRLFRSPWKPRFLRLCPNERAQNNYTTYPNGNLCTTKPDPRFYFKFPIFMFASTVKTKTVQASMNNCCKTRENQDSWDHAQIKERKQLYNLAERKPLYDQTRP